MSDEKTSQRVATIAAKAMQNPKSLTSEEIQALAASALNQSPNQASRPAEEPIAAPISVGQQQNQQKK